MAEMYPLQILLASLAGWMNRRQGEVLEYLIERECTDHIIPSRGNWPGDRNAGARRAAPSLLADSVGTLKWRARTDRDGGEVCSFLQNCVPAVC